MLPLTGIRVIDMSRLLAGPFCTAILGDLGADVIKVEGLPDGDLYRQSPPFHGDQSVCYLAANRNKRSIAIDFRRQEGLDLIRRMASEADVFVENFKPGVIEAMGLSYDQLAASNPRLVYASVSGFGRTGPYGHLPGVDQIAQGMSGLMSVTGHPETGPTRVGVPIADLVAALWTAIGVQTAIIARQASGQGQRVDISLLGALISLLSIQGQRYLSLGQIPEVAGNHHPTSSPYGLFRASDGELNFSAMTEAMWRRLCGHLGLDELPDDPRFSSSAARRENRVELERMVEERLMLRPRDQWIAELRQLGLPAGPVYTIGEVFDDPAVEANGVVETVKHSSLGPLKLLASPLKFASLPGVSIRRAPPRLGEHTNEILHEFGYDEATIEALARAAVIASAGSAARPGGL